MKYECPICPETFASPRQTLVHINLLHPQIEKHRPVYSKIIQLQTQNFALKIKKLPKKIIIPREYMGAFTARD